LITKKREGIRESGGGWFCALFQLLFFLLASVAPVASAQEDETQNFTESRLIFEEVDLRGYVSTKYVLRSADVSGDQESDNDLYEYLRLDATVPKDRKYEIHFFGTARQDIDGKNDEHDFYPLEDIGDARDEPSTGTLYDAHLAINNPFLHISQVRFGRQAGTRDEPVFFDGVALDAALSQRIFITAYGGAAAHFEELEYEWGDDTVAGAGLDISPTFDSVISMDYLYIQDKRDFFGFEDQEDHLISLKVWQRFTKYISGMTRFRYLNDDARDIRVKAGVTFPDAGFQISAGYFRQFGEETEHTNETSIYYDIVGTTAEFHSFDIKARKFFGEHYAIDVGYYDRRLLDSNDESSFNRDYSRLYAAFDVADLLMKRLTLSLIGEYWETGDNSYQSGGLDASYTLKKGRRKGELSAGTYYSLYKYDYYDDRDERDDVQTYYARAVIPIGGHFSADGKYEYEDGSDDFQTFTFGVRYDF
jgi:hypothetical protein